MCNFERRKNANDRRALWLVHINKSVTLDVENVVRGVWVFHAKSVFLNQVLSLCRWSTWSFLFECDDCCRRRRRRRRRGWNQAEQNTAKRREERSLLHPLDSTKIDEIVNRAKRMGKQREETAHTYVYRSFVTLLERGAMFSLPSAKSRYSSKRKSNEQYDELSMRQMSCTLNSPRRLLRPSNGQFNVSRMTKAAATLPRNCKLKIFHSVRLSTKALELQASDCFRQSEENGTPIESERKVSLAPEHGS